MLNPPALPSNDSGNGHVPLLLVLTLEEIWRARNFSLHHNCHWDISASIRLVHSRYFEYTAISAPPNCSPASPMRASLVPTALRVHQDQRGCCHFNLSSSYCSSSSRPPWCTYQNLGEIDKENFPRPSGNRGVTLGRSACKSGKMEPCDL